MRTIVHVLTTCSRVGYAALTTNQEMHAMAISQKLYDEATKTYSMVTTFVGAVLQTFERNGSWDSDFIAIVWDEALGKVREVEYATTRFPTYENGAVADVTPENLAKAQAYAWGVNLSILQAQDRAQARLATQGKAVSILPTATGRSRRSKGIIMAPGTVAYVAARVLDTYATKPWSTLKTYRVALQLDGQLVYLDEDAVEVIDPEQYETPAAELERRAGRAESITNFHRPVPGFLAAVS